MTAVLQRMNSIAGHVRTLVTAEESYWAFNDYLHSMGKDFFTPLTRKHGLLNVEYSILCAQIIKDSKRDNTNQDEITEQLVSALMMSEILAYIYRHYLDVPSEVARMHKDQLILVRLLEAQGYHFGKCALHVLSEFPLEKSKYSCSYVLTGKELYYIDAYGTEEKAPITDYEKLSLLVQKKLIAKKYAKNKTCYLSREEIKKNITLNGGHTPYDKKNSILPEEDSFTTLIRRKMGDVNWYRLIMVRAKRVFNASVPLAKSMESYCDVIAAIDRHVNPVIAHMSWLFFIPRLSTNLFLMFKHMVPGSWMSQSEKDLGVFFRMNLQFQRRWFELANDSVWMVAGILNCFVWIGTLAPVGIYLTVILFAYDVVLASVRAVIELYRLKGLVERYETMADDLHEKCSFTEEAEVRRFIESIEARIFFEQKRQLLPVINAVILLLSAILTLPAMLAISPIIPLIGACMAVTTTIATYFLGRVFSDSAPDDKLLNLPGQKPDPQTSPKKSVYVGGMVLFKHVEKSDSQEVNVNTSQCCFG